MWMRRALEIGVDLLAGRGCVHCGALYAGSLPLCDQCRLALGRLAPGPRMIAAGPIADRYSAFSFEGPARSLVHAFKFRGSPQLARELAQLMLPLPRWIERATIVPVPTTPTRTRSRGFDQAALLADAVGRLTGRPVEPLLARRPGRPQTGRPRRERQQLGADNYFLQNGVKTPRTDLVLLDDVSTTGVTLGSCASALSRSADAIYAITFAGTPGKRRYSQFHSG